MTKPRKVKLGRYELDENGKLVRKEDLDIKGGNNADDNS